MRKLCGTGVGGAGEMYMYKTKVVSDYPKLLTLDEGFMYRSSEEKLCIDEVRER